MILFFTLLLSFFLHSKPIPLFSAPTLQGKKFEIESVLNKNKMILISFWATWCGNCLEEMKELKTLEAQSGGKLQIITVNVDTGETSSQILPTVTLHKINWPVLKDPQQLLLSKFNLSKSIPYNLLVSPQGEILQTFEGYSETVVSEIKKHL